MFDEPLPEEPQTIEAILHEVENNIFANSTLYLLPRFFGYINAGGNQAAILGELLASAVNQILGKWHFSPAASEVERRVLRWIAQFIGYSSEAGGCLLSGGSAGNFAGLAVARKQKAPFDADSLGMRGGAPVTVYMSQEGHASVDKSVILLGIGRAQALAEFCRKQDLWFHVDAAYGGPAAGTEVAGKLFCGLDQADSVLINPHKWLYVPVEAACILVREPRALRDTFQVSADYLSEEIDTGTDGRFDFKDYGPQMSRNFRALKIWMTFKAYGARKLRTAIASNIEIMRYLADRIDQSQDFVRHAPVPLSVVCFQYRTSDASVHTDQNYLDDLNTRLLDALEKDGRVFLSGTRIHGKKVLRACGVNHRLRRHDVDVLLEVIRDVARSLIS